MKIRRPALASTTVSTAVLALALATPGTAFAADAGSDKGHEGRAAAQQSDRKAQPQPAAAQQAEPAKPEQDEGAGVSGSAPAKKDASRPAPGSRGHSTAKKESAAVPAKQGKGKPASAPDQGKADPPGNNGTIKISSLPAGESRGNQPHPGCSFALVHYGFDAGQTADITFTHHAPTGSGETLLSRSGVAISDDAAGGGQDRDAVLTFTAADLGLTGAAPHEQGWHVKVAVDATQAPGGAKQKVFWLDCPGGTAGTGAESTEGPATGTETTTGQTGGEGAVATDVLSGSLVRSTASSTVGSTASTSRDSAVGVLSASASRTATAKTATTKVAAAPASKTPADSGALPSVLPFTGAGTVAFLFGLAVLALAAGGAFLRAGHRRGV